MGRKKRRLLTKPLKHIESAPSIEVDRLTVAYDGVPALEDVSFSLPPGKRVAVVGPNAAGKTSLFRAISGTLEPKHGSVHVFGHGPAGHVCIAYVPQRSQVDWHFPVTVAEVVMMGRVRKIGFFHWPRKSDWEEVRQVLERVGLAEEYATQIGSLSGGQQQRAFLARAIAQQAELILLDEPLTGLDLPSQDVIFGMIDDLCQQGITIMVATHDLNMASDRFDLVMLINRRLIAYGPPEEVLKSHNLVQAYGRQLHVLPGDEDIVLLTDTCCEGDEGGE